MSVGIGFDIHRLVAGRKLLLGGIEIPHSVGLLGHSDGDVVLHAVIDAYLGATGGGDIGERFPDTDPQWKDAPSEAMLRSVLTRRWDVENVDVTIVAEEPKLGARKREIASGVARIFGIDAARVNVKAKTAEGLGPIGNREAIACLAVCEVKRR